MLTLPVKLMSKQQCMRCIDAKTASETDGQTTMSCIVLMLTLPVKLMAKQQCMRCIDINSACETDGQTTMYALY